MERVLYVVCASYSRMERGFSSMEEYVIDKRFFFIKKFGGKQKKDILVYDLIIGLN